MLMNKWIVFTFLSILLASLFIIGCAPATENVEGENWVIFSAEYAKNNRFGTGLVPASTDLEYWTPTEADIRALEDDLPSFLQSNSDQFFVTQSPPWERLSEYQRQYIGLMINGEQVIYANYFCRSFNENWNKEFVFVLDGGACYFQFKNNPQSGEFFDLHVNGEA